jgi:hypothetical protein
MLASTWLVAALLCGDPRVARAESEPAAPNASAEKAAAPAAPAGASEPTAPPARADKPTKPFVPTDRIDADSVVPFPADI